MRENNWACVEMTVGQLRMSDKSLGQMSCEQTRDLSLNGHQQRREMAGSSCHGSKGGPMDGDVTREQASTQMWREPKEMTMYLRRLLCLELPHQVALLGNTSVRT